MWVLILLVISYRFKISYPFYPKKFLPENKHKIILKIEWNVHRTSNVSTNSPILWFLHKIHRNAELLELAVLCLVHPVRVRGCNDHRLRVQSTASQVLDRILPLQNSDKIPRGNVNARRRLLDRRRRSHWFSSSIEDHNLLRLET